jgi:uncharacterized protein (TIGR02246 family)
MSRILAPLLVFLLCFGTLSAAQVLAGAGALEAEEEVARATAAWVDAYNSRDAARIVALYAPDALFWGTRATAIASTPERIAAYFQESVRNRNLRVTINDRRIRVYGQVGVSAGVYTVTDLKDGQEVSTPGRFTFVFEKRAGRWVIVHHHSSRMPSP